MGKLLSISLLLVLFQLPGLYPLEKGRPTPQGIALYVEERGPSVMKEFQDFVGDSLYNVWLYSSDSKELLEENSHELGRHYPHEIYISETGRFVAYELADLSPRKRRSFRECNRFVKTVMLHELCHEYFHQVGVEMESVLGLDVDKAYQTGLWIIVSFENFGSSFIQEGLSEYLCGAMGELIVPEQADPPKNLKELHDGEREYEIKYKYGAAFLKPFLDTAGFKRGVQTLLHNPPPTQEEILHPGLFYDRLESPVFGDSGNQSNLIDR